MKTKNVLLVTTIIMLLVILSPSTIVFACDCDVPDNASEALERADAVFTGVVTKMKEIKIDGEIYDAVLIQVNQIWKGINDSQVIVYTDWSSCMFEFQLGEEYLLYASDYDNKLDVINCGRSSLVSKASTDLLELGEGKEPGNQVNLEAQFNKPNWNYPIIILLGVVLLFIIGGVIWKIKKK